MQEVKISKKELKGNLEEKCVEKRSVRKILSTYGLTDLSHITKPLAEMSEDAAIKAVLKWIVLNSENGQKYKVRLPVKERQTVYEIQLIHIYRVLRVASIKERPELNKKALHCWFRDVSYQMLIMTSYYKAYNAQMR